MSFASGVVIHKVRLLDEFDNEALTPTVDPNLISYYELMADKGDANAQVKHFQRKSRQSSKIC